MKRVIAGLLLGCLAACSSTVSGSPAGGPPAAPSRTVIPTTTVPLDPGTSAEKTTPLAPPTAIDEHADQQYCPTPITGALGRKMQVVVVATPTGRIPCDQAAAVLTDYYRARPTPDPAAAPIQVGTFACDQVPNPDLPQVICAGPGSLFFSMWPQT